MVNKHRFVNLFELKSLIDKKSNEKHNKNLLSVRFSIPTLDFGYDALEPNIDKETMIVHHTKHHQEYVDNLNKVKSNLPVAQSLYKLLEGILNTNKSINVDMKTLCQYGGGHYNHSLFWKYLCKNSSRDDISQSLNDRIIADFGTFEKFKEQFDAEATKMFGSGWTWYVYDYSQEKGYITSTRDQINPIMSNSNVVCMLGIDVWEHAFYLKYNNRKPEYIANFWNVINWKTVSKIHDVIVKQKAKLEITDDGQLIFNE